jgi:D-aminoacyl-tRNA deacylase
VLGVVVSEADPASTHVHEQLLEVADWEEIDDESTSPATGGGTVYRLADVELRTFEELHLELEDVAGTFDDPTLIAFASRHSGDTGPLLSAHHTGNFGPAEFGGHDRTLARAAPNALRTVLEALAVHAPEDYEVGLECTHHGPGEVGAPSLFVEVGSSPEEWGDSDAARAVARAILALRDCSPDVPRADGSRRHLVGFGGGHYAPRFERVVRETDWAVGHVAADWALEAMGDPADAVDVIETAFVESRAELALILGCRPDLAGTIEALDYRTVDETWVRETTGVPQSLVADLEGAIGTVAEGLRFGAPARGVAPGAVQETGFVVGTVPRDLHETASGIDREGTLAAVDGLAIAYDTDQGGSVVEGTVALTDRGDGDHLIDRFVDLLATSYDNVTREDREVVAVTDQFDPDLARKAGVTPGPDFGRLAEGEPVTVEGVTVRPDDVTATVERRFSTTITWR